ncbi:GNAT family N-acetyltransferase [Frankia sp. AgPm24]|uniref:GNAT family N-acetyltransferase n=1 Tax=Frankia sp. AgPm24 TaxID=631128 RepID=UPI00200EBAA3|nr:GNAT family N-acetyltransferase [Frankia sp. AgPm24]MCK9920811.1 GNAT family N-acetyltransferase [Frankia sp. AgPm24]
MGEGPTLTTSRLLALPLTVWNAGYVAEELASALSFTSVVVGSGGPRQPGVAPDGGLVGTDPYADRSDPRDPAGSLRRELRRRAGAGRSVLTWVLRRRSEPAAVGLLVADTQGRRAVVGVSIAFGYRREGYATEAVRAAAGWLEYRGVLVETRIRRGDAVGKRLGQATSFVPTPVLVAGWWRVWLRPPAG